MNHYKTAQTSYTLPATPSITDALSQGRAGSGTLGDLRLLRLKGRKAVFQAAKARVYAGVQIKSWIFGLSTVRTS